MNNDYLRWKLELTNQEYSGQLQEQLLVEREFNELFAFGYYDLK